MWDWRDRRAKKRLQFQQAAESIQTLEPRTLLTGNVLAAMSGPNLFVNGDAADNQLEVTVVNNQVVLRGLTNTNINGSTALFVIADNTDTAPGKITIHTGAGNDSVVFSRNVKVAGNAFVDGGAGNDSLSVTGATFQQSISMYGRVGNDTISVQNATVDGILRLKGNSGNDLISVTNTTTNGGTNIVGGDGADGVSFNDVTANAWTKITTGAGNDDISIVNSNINGFLRVKTRQGADVLQMDGNTVNGNVAINMGRNNDAVKLVNTNTFNGFFHVQAGDGHPIASSLDPGDQVNLGTTTVFAQGSRVRKADTSTVSTTLSDRIDAATTGLKARATAADTAATALGGLELTLDNSANTTTDSVGGAFITRNADFTVAGATLPGAVVTLDTDGDGNFDDGTLTADSLGKFTTVVTLQRTDLNTATAANDQLNGFNKIKIRSTAAGVGSKDTELNVDYVPSTHKIVQFTTNKGTYEVEMFNDLTPNTVANFLSYSSDYTNAIVQRLVTNFVFQAGGYTVANNQISAITKKATIANEFNSSTSNIRGTISMATAGGNINSGSSEWFINTANNNTGTGSLDAVPHTVFGRVIGNGMTVVDAIAALTAADLSAATGIGNSTDGPLNTVPMQTPFTALSKTVAGTVSTTTGSKIITGVGTSFLSEFKGSSTGAGSRISVNGQTMRVVSVESDTSLTVDVAATATATAQAAKTDDFADANFVKFSSIAEILSV
jgi:cyclophilin family peptidyl-prolyl cis-trans isomerase